MVLYKESLDVREWKRSANRETEVEQEEWKADIMWVVVEISQQKVAMGLVYLATGHHNTLWNEGLHNTLQRDITDLEQEGYLISIWGDFNGHVRLRRDGSKSGEDDNGRFIVNLEEESQLIIVNFTPKCLGRWTWARQEARSTIDYVIMGPALFQQVMDMIIDEKGERWTIGADHNFIQVQLKGAIKKRETPPQKQIWRINQETDWDKYSRELSLQLTEWMQEYDQAGPHVDLEQAYQHFVHVLVTVAEETVGIRGTAKKKHRVSRKMKKAIQKRKKLWSKWRAVCCE